MAWVHASQMGPEKGIGIARKGWGSHKPLERTATHKLACGGMATHFINRAAVPRRVLKLQEWITRDLKASQPAGL